MEETTVFQDIKSLVKKICLFAIVMILLLTFIFGVFRYHDNSMVPAIKEGDLVFYYRLDKHYLANDCVAYQYKENRLVGRVVAIEGDVVDITEEGLKINGSLQQEKINSIKTLPYIEGISFPVTLEKGQIFILGDNREKAEDGRVFGAVLAKDTLGKVITIIRNRDI